MVEDIATFADPEKDYRIEASGAQWNVRPHVTKTIKLPKQGIWFPRGRDAFAGSKLTGDAVPCWEANAATAQCSAACTDHRMTDGTIKPAVAEWARVQRAAGRRAVG